MASQKKTALAKSFDVAARTLMAAAPTYYPLCDLENALIKVIEISVLKRLDEIFDQVRELKAANDSKRNDLPLVYRLPDVLKLLRISKSTLYDWQNPLSELYIPSMPGPFKLADHANSPSFWSGPDLRAWIEARSCASRARLH